MAVVTVWTVLAGAAADPQLPGLSLWVLGSAMVTAAILLIAYRGLHPGWLWWRRVTLVLFGLTVAYPALWAALSLTAAADPHSLVTRILATVVTVAHVPVLASLSLLPLLAIRYIGHGSSPRLIAILVCLAATTGVLLVVFAPPMSPAGLEPLVDFAPAVAVGMGLNLVFLASTLVGPVAATRAARSATGEARSRLVLVAVAALSGPLLVLGCGVLGGVAAGSPDSHVPAVLLLCGMNAALAAVVVGTSRALRTPLALGPRSLSRIAMVMVAWSAGLVAVTVVLLVDPEGALGGVVAAGLAVAVMLSIRPLEAWVARVLVAPAQDAHDRAPAQFTQTSRLQETIDGVSVKPSLEPEQAAQECNKDLGLAVLTPREREVLGLLAEGLSNSGIAARLVLSERTVDAHLRSVFSKLALPDSTHANRRVHAVLAWNRTR